MPDPNNVRVERFLGSLDFALEQMRRALETLTHVKSEYETRFKQEETTFRQIAKRMQLNIPGVSGTAFSDESVADMDNYVFMLSQQLEDPFEKFVLSQKTLVVEMYQVVINVLLENYLIKYRRFYINSKDKDGNLDMTVIYPVEQNHYKEKQLVVEFLNSHIREYGAAVAHPETKEPCILFALPTKGGFGRYTLENRKTKKRSGYYKSIVELQPIQLVPDVPRKEGVLETRKKKGEKPAE